jgi:hypothetical protein
MFLFTLKTLSSYTIYTTQAEFFALYAVVGVPSRRVTR